MSQINLLYLIRTWALGGSHTIIRLFLKHLPRDRFNIVVVPYDAPGTGNEDFIASVRKQGGDVAPERIPWRSRGNWFAARRTIAELIEKYDVDCMHCHDTQSNVLVGLGRKRWPCACVASPYGWWQPPWHLQAHVYHWVENHLALPQFDRIYTVSQNMKQKVLRGGSAEDRIDVIHTGLDLDAMDAGAPRTETRAGFGFDDGQVVVGTVSRLFKEKGHRYLLDAAALLAPEHPELRLLIVGAGDERGPLEAKAARLGIADRVHFTGFYDDLPGALRAMDIFAQPSILAEGFPTSVLEAQVAGLPVIASDIGGTHETIDVGKTGLLVPPKDVSALAQALRELLANPEKRQTMAAAARPWIENAFTLPQMMARIQKTYEQAVESYRAAQG